ncbi:MAG: acyltransferase family protein, partial [Bacteroidota bacterium]
MEQAETPNNSALPYFPNLDGLRFISFAIVFFSHGIVGTTGLLEDYNYLAFTGLDFFFVLSAFLITHRLLSEQKVKGKISLKRFIYRRSLRVWPLYFLTVFVGFCLHAYALRSEMSPEPLPPLWTFMTFTVNFWMANHGTSFLFFMVFLWSICLEEQFYSMLGILMRFASKLLVPVCSLMVAVSLWFRFEFQSQSLQLLYNSLSLMGAFGVGSLAAWIGFNFKERICNLFADSGVFWTLFYGGFILNLVFFPIWYNDFPWSLLDRPILWFFMAFVIIGQCLPSKVFIPMGYFSSFRYLGKISYGMYIFHGVFILLLLKAPISFEAGGFYQVFMRPLLI